MTIPIEITHEIQKRLLEIETYRSHYLYKEARIRCQELAKFIRKTAAVTSKQAFITKISFKIKQIDAEAKAFSTLSATVKMSPEEHTVVRQLFASGKGDSASAAFETATVLLVFGQRSAALKAFRNLLNNDTHRIVAAKSIIRCHLGDGRIQRAVDEYLAWYMDDSFPHQTIDSVRIFLQAILTKKGYSQQLPEPIIIEEVQSDRATETVTSDFLAVVLSYADKRFRAKKVSLDINFQRGKMINCIVPKYEKGLIDFLKAGMVFPDAQISGTDMINFCSVRLSEVSKIRVGQHAGDTTITLEVMDDDD